MASDAIVTSQDILQSLMQLRRLGNQRVLKDLEQLEPDLTEFLLEEHTAIHHRLLEIAAAPKAVRQLSPRIETMALVLVMSLRQSHLRLWQQDHIEPEASADADTLPAPKPPSAEQ